MATQSVMIARIGRGWSVIPADADLHEEFLRAVCLPSAHAIKGCHGATVVRCNSGGVQVQLATLRRFERLESIRDFAGEDCEAAHVAPTVSGFLSRFDARRRQCECIEDRTCAATDRLGRCRGKPD